MAKPSRVYFTGVAPRVNGSPLGRVQTFSIDPDLNFTEMYELGNPNIVEYDRDTPTVTVTINTNDYASIMNLRKVTNILTGDITLSALEGKSVSVDALIEQDSVLKRTMIAANCFLSSVSWSYDVGGVATENYTFTTNNKSVYTAAYRQAVILPVTYIGTDDTNASGYIASGVGLLTSGSADKYSWSGHATKDSYNLTNYTGLYVWNDNFRSTSGSTLSVGTDAGQGAQDTAVVWSGENTLTSGSRIFAIAFKDTPLTDLTTDYTTEPGVASVRKGQVVVDIAPAGSGGTYGQWYRVQTIGIDADVGRTQLDELGSYYPFYQSLPDPIVVTANITMLDSDVEAFYDAAGLTYNETTSLEFDIDDFARQAAIRVRVYTTKDRLATELRKTMILEEIQVTTESFSTDVQDNARQTMTATTSNFTVTGADLA